MQTQANAPRLAYQREDLANRLVARAELILYHFEDSGRKIRFYGGTLMPKAEGLLDDSEVAYTAGTLDFLTRLAAGMQGALGCATFRASRENLTYEQASVAVADAVICDRLDERRRSRDIQPACRQLEIAMLLTDIKPCRAAGSAQRPALRDDRGPHVHRILMSRQ